MLDTHAFVMVDAEGVIRVWSPGAERLFGYDAPSAIGQTLDLIVPESYRERHWAGFSDAVARGAPKLDQPAANLPVLCRDGRVVRFPGRLLFLRDARDRVVGAMGIFAPNDGAEGPALPNM
ncbi:MAG: PAS domain S-box protein [Dehalococcoidia bacterium]